MQSSYVRSSKTVDPLENVAVVVNNVNGGVMVGNMSSRHRPSVTCGDIAM